MIFLDFDGVLFDTVREAFAVSMITIGDCEKIEEINFESKEYKTFQAQRHLVKTAWNYKFIMDSLGESNAQKKQTLDFNDNNSRSKSLEFEEKYFATRKILKKNHWEQWASLNRPYDFLQKIKPYMIKYPHIFVIISTKDRETIKHLLTLEGLNANELVIFGNDAYEEHNGKAGIIQSARMITTEKALFIDDNREHLDECLGIPNLKLFHANWGYIAPDERNKALSESAIFEQLTRFITCLV